MARAKAQTAAPTDAVTVAYLDQRFFNLYMILGGVAAALIAGEMTLHLSHFARMDSLLEHKGEISAKIDAVKENLDRLDKSLDGISRDLVSASKDLTRLQAKLETENSDLPPTLLARPRAVKSSRTKRR